MTYELGRGDGAGAQGKFAIDGGMTITPATAAVGLTITQANANNAISINCDATAYYAITSTAKFGQYINCDIADGRGLYIYRNNTAAEAYPLVLFQCDNTSDTKAALSLRHDGTGPHITTDGTNESLRLGPNGTGEVQFSYNSIRNFAFSGVAVAAYAGAATVAGQAFFAALQNGGAAAAAEGFAGASGTLTAGTGSAAVLGAGGAGGGWNFYTGTGGNGTTAGGSGGVFKIVCGNAGTGGTGTNGRLQVWHGSEGGGDYVEAYHDATNGWVGSGSGVLNLTAVGGVVQMQCTTRPATDNAYDVGTSALHFRSNFLGQDTVTGPVSTSGLYLGLAQEVRLRWNKDATAMPAASLILGLNAVGSAAKDTIAFSAAAITGFNALTGVAGSILYCAMQSGLDSNMPGGSLDWSGGTAHGSGTGGSLLLHPGGTTSGTRGNVTIYQDAIATTSTDGLLLENATPATAGVPAQYSPRARFRGHAFNSVSGLDETHDWIFEIQTTGFAGATGGNLFIRSSFNGAVYASRAELTSTGSLYVTSLFAGSLSPSGSVTLTLQNRAFSAADSAIEAATGAWTHSSGEGVAVEIKPTWNASGTAGEICLKLNPTKSAVGSGVYLGIDARGWAAGDAILGLPVDAGALGAYYGRMTVYINGVGLKAIPIYEAA